MMISNPFLVLENNENIYYVIELLFGVGTERA